MAYPANSFDWPAHSLSIWDFPWPLMADNTLLFHSDSLVIAW